MSRSEICGTYRRREILYKSIFLHLRSVCLKIIISGKVYSDGKRIWFGLEGEKLLEFVREQQKLEQQKEERP